MNAQTDVIVKKSCLSTMRWKQKISYMKNMWQESKNDLYLVTKLLHASAVTASMHGKTPNVYTCSFG
jgi:hypothetical protein